MMHAAEDGPVAASGLNLAETLATRICHDLAGQLGALTGALELADEDPSLQAEAMAVAIEAATMLGHRLRLLRSAWGRTGDAMSVDELRNLTRGVPLGRRVSMSLDGLAADQTFAPGAAQVLLNLLMLGVECLEGTGVVEAIGGSGGSVIVSISGPRAAWPAGFALMLADRAEADAGAQGCDPRHMLATLTALLAHRGGHRVSMLMSPRPEQAAPVLLSLD